MRGLRAFVLVFALSFVVLASGVVFASVSCMLECGSYCVGSRFYDCAAMPPINGNNCDDCGCEYHCVKGLCEGAICGADEDCDFPVCASGGTCTSSCTCSCNSAPPNPCDGEPCAALEDDEISSSCTGTIKNYQYYTGACLDNGDGIFNQNDDCVKSSASQNCANVAVCYNTTHSQTGYCSGGNCYTTRTACPSDYYTCSTTNRVLRDYFCSGGCTYTDSVVQNCAASNGWYNTGSQYLCCHTSTAWGYCQNQEYRTYTCASGACTYSVTGTQTVPVGASTTCATGVDFCIDASTLRHYTGAVCGSGTCNYPYIDMPCTGGCTGGVCNTNEKPVVQSITYTGTCNSGQPLTVQCTVWDAEQDPATLGVRGWIGQCATGDCFNTRSWATGTGITYMNNWPMTYSSGGAPSSAVFTYSFTVEQPVGTSIAADCQATDNMNQVSDWGKGGYPLCTVGGCTPLVVIINSITPNPATVGTVQIDITITENVINSPNVRVDLPGGASESATFVSFDSGTGRYVYSYTVTASDPVDGPATVTVSAQRASDLCMGSTVSNFYIDKTPPVTTAYFNGLSGVTSIAARELNFTFSCTDALNCAYTRYSVQNRTATTPFTNYPPMYTVNTTGEYNVSYFSADTLGNLETTKKSTIMFMSTALCDGVICTVPENVCMDENTLRQCTDSICIDGLCVDTCANINCPYGCMYLPGPDVCVASERPVLTDARLESTYQNYGKYGDTVNIYSFATAGGANLRLRCGTSPSTGDFCTSTYVVADPMCSSTNPYPVSGEYPIYCYAEKEDGSRSLRTEELTLISDNEAPSLNFSTVPATPFIAPGTPFQVYAIASDALSGVNRTSIYFDGTLAKVCEYLTCNQTFTSTYGWHNYSATAMDNVGNINRTGSSLTGNITVGINHPPNITSNMTYTGQCISGGTITVYCTAEDMDQPSNTLTVLGWTGNCTANDCFLSRGWAAGGITYMNAAPMDPPAVYTGGRATFTKTFTISPTQDSGTGVAGTCRATDVMGAMNMPPEQGDAYPLCVVSGCTNPPEITIDYIRPNPANVGFVDIAFTASRDLRVDPPVNVTPGFDEGYRTEYPATLVSKNGRSYVYTFEVISGYRDGPALVNIRANAADNNCPRNEVTTFVIDKTPPLVTPMCTSAGVTEACREVPYVYRAPLVITFACNDLTGCNITYYGINSTPVNIYSPTSPPVITTSGNYLLRYTARDYAGNIAPINNKNLKVYGSPFDEEVRVYVELDSHVALLGEPVTGTFYCFLRDKQNKAIKTRDCSVAPNGLKITVDKGTANVKDYFTKTGTTPDAFLMNHTIEFGADTPKTVGLDSLYYQLTRGWSIDLDTNIFHSRLCINMTDELSGINGEDCTNYTVTDAKILPDLIFPDVIAGVVPYTSDRIPPQRPAPNFTKTMPIRFDLMAYLAKLLGPTTQCTGVDCRVEFSFLPYDSWNTMPPNTARWSSFANAYVPDTEDVLSEGFECNRYQTLYTRTWIQGGPYSGMYEDNYSDIFVNCDVKVTVNPLEVRLAVGQSAGKIFNISIWNPTNTAKSFNLDATSTNSLGYPLQWIRFDCAGTPDCTVGPSDDHLYIGTVPPMGSRTVAVIMDVAVKSGAFPVTFVAENSVTGDKYAAIGNILIFSEGLEEFALWQLIILAGAAAGYLVFFL